MSQSNLTPANHKKTMEITYHKKQLQLKYPFTISRWTYTHRPSLIVELRMNGFSGYGEATENPYYKNTAVSYMVERIDQITTTVKQSAGLPPAQFWKNLHQKLQDCPFALCALDEAYHDWYTKSQKQSLSEYWNLDLSQQAKTCFTLSIDPIDIMVERMRNMPWPIYKIKLGTDQDIEIVESLRKHSSATFWVDANCAWTVEETIEKSKKLAALGVEFIEQPLPAEDWEGMMQVSKKTALPIIADEACKTIDDIYRCKTSFAGVNIKVMKCGGLTPALEMIKTARTEGLKVMVGCMTESTVGISAIAHLAPLIDFADMDGQHFIKDDPATGVQVTANGIIFMDSPGTGVQLKEEKLSPQ